MAWKAPKIVEVSVGMEINTYVCYPILERHPDGRSPRN